VTTLVEASENDTFSGIVPFVDFAEIPAIDGGTVTVIYPILFSLIFKVS